MRSQLRHPRWQYRLAVRGCPIFLLATALALAACGTERPPDRPPVATAPALVGSIATSGSEADAVDERNEAPRISVDLSNPSTPHLTGSGFNPEAPLLVAVAAREADLHSEFVTPLTHIAAAPDGTIDSVLDFNPAWPTGPSFVLIIRNLETGVAATAPWLEAPPPATPVFSPIALEGAMVLAAQVMQDGLAALEMPLATWRPALDDGLDRLDAAADELARDAALIDDAAWRAEVEAALAGLRAAAGEMAVAGQAVAGRAEDAHVGEQLGAAGSRLAALVTDIERALAAGDADGMRAVIGAAGAARDVLGGALDALERALP